jgi:DNA-directed RNA polymerase subunit RPC12/RpoP
MEHVTIKTFNNAIEAHILKNRLESEGITCFIRDENIVTVNPLYNYAVGGIKLDVQETDVERAIKILAEIEDAPFTDEADEVILCPKCGSDDLYANFTSMKDAKGILAAIAAFFFAVFPIYYKSVYRCKNCGHEFKKK